MDTQNLAAGVWADEATILEDIAPIITSQVLATPTERIDLIFEKGLTPLNIERTLRADPPFASNHTDWDRHASV